MDAVVGEGDSGEAADNAENERFAEQLTHETRATGTERGADGDFSRARSGASEQKIGDVGARDKEHEADGAEQNEQRRFHFADEKVAQRDHADGPAVVVFGILFREAIGDGVELSVSLIESHAGLDAAGDAEANGRRDARSNCRTAGHRRCGIQIWRLCCTCGKRKYEGITPMTVNARLSSVIGAADDVGIGAERAAPKIFAEDDDGSGAGFSIVGNKSAAENRLNAKGGEEIGRDDGGVDYEGIAAARERELMCLNAGEAEKNVGLCAENRACWEKKSRFYFWRP